MIHTGASLLHVPSAMHVLELDPFRLYPTLQVYVAVSPYVVPSFVVTRPLFGGDKLPQSSLLKSKIYQMKYNICIVN